MKENFDTNRDILAETTIDNIFQKLAAKKSLQEGEHYWFGISGSWRKTNDEIEKTVRKTVHDILSRNGGIVSGGALGVDFFATEEALKENPTAEKIKVFLPVALKLYATHYRKRADKGVITHEQAEALIEQLTKLKEANSDAIIENPNNTEVNEITYHERNTDVMNASDALAAFHVNETKGVQDTVDKAIEQGKPVLHLKYNL